MIKRAEVLKEKESIQEKIIEAQKRDRVKKRVKIDDRTYILAASTSKNNKCAENYRKKLEHAKTNLIR